MRGAILYVLLSGIGWFVCTATVLAVSLIDLGGLLRERPRGRRAAGFAVLLAAAISVLTGTPLPLWLAALLGVPVLVYAALGPGRSRAVAIAAGLAAAVAAGVEAPWFFEGERTASPERIAVIGDSLSSGGFAESVAWPEIVAQDHGVAVSNLARPSDTTAAAARDQIAMLRGEETIVIAVGGNDLLGDTPASAFARDLERLVRAARAAGATRIWMLELPIPPGAWAYGRTQRRVARDHDVRLIPKRVVLRVLTDPASTDDGLHPTSAGHARLAREIARALGLRRS